MNLADRQQGGIWGQLIGDALGVSYETKPPAELTELPEDLADVPPPPFQRSHRFAYSADGARALCLLETLKANRGVFNADGFAQRLLRWLDHGHLAVKDHVFGTGGTTQKALARIRMGTPALEAGLTEETALGNGGLVGVIPLPLFFEGTDVELVYAAMDQCRVTHAHPRARVTVAVFCLWIRELLWADDPSLDPFTLAVRTAERSFAFLRSDEYEECELLLATLAGEHGPPMGGFYVVDTFHSAVVCQRSSYEETVRAAIMLGNDTDTTAAVAGGVAGVRFGINGIPLRWREMLEMVAAPEALALIRLDGQTSSQG